MNLTWDISSGHLMINVTASVRSLVQCTSSRLIFSLLGWAWFVCGFSFFHPEITHLQQSAWFLNVHCLVEFRYEHIQHTSTHFYMEHNSSTPGPSSRGNQYLEKNCKCISVYACVSMHVFMHVCSRVCVAQICECANMNNCAHTCGDQSRTLGVFL